MARTVLIIGNGFDIELGLQSSYSQFAMSPEWKDLVRNKIEAYNLYKEMQRKSLQWIREQSMDANCIESLATHDTDIKPHVIEL